MKHDNYIYTGILNFDTVTTLKYIQNKLHLAIMQEEGAQDLSLTFLLFRRKINLAQSGRSEIIGNIFISWDDLN